MDLHFRRSAFAVFNFVIPAALAASGALDLTFDRPPFPDGPRVAHSVVVQPDGGLIVAGAHIVRHDPSGAVDTLFGGTTPAEGYFAALVLQPDGKVLVGGGANFGEGYVLRFLPNGEPDPDFTPVFPGGNVTCLALLPDGRIAAGGFFHAFGRANLILLHPNGQPDAGFDARVSADGVVLSLAAQPDGGLLVGTGYGATIGNRLGFARVFTTGALDPSFAALSAPYGVSALVVLPNGRILAGAEQMSDGVNTRSGVVRILPNGMIDPSFDTGLTVGRAEALAVQPWDGRVIAAGPFFRAGTAEIVVRLQSNGVVDSGFDAPLSGDEDFVQGLAVQADGKVLVAGYFETQDTDLVRLENDSFPATIAFSATTYRAMENDRFALVTAIRYGDASGFASVTVQTTSGVAHPFQGFVPVFAQLRFAPGEIMRNVVVRLRDDRRRNEPDEIVGLRLSACRYRGRSTALGLQRDAVLTIVDDDRD